MTHVLNFLFHLLLVQSPERRHPHAGQLIRSERSPIWRASVRYLEVPGDNHRTVLLRHALLILNERFLLIFQIYHYILLEALFGTRTIFTTSWAQIAEQISH